MAITNSQINSEFSGIAITDASGLVIGLDVEQFAVANVGNLTIPGGSAGQVLSTDGNGALSWAPAAGGVTQVATQGTETFVAASAQTSFTLSRTVNGTVTGAINGVTSPSAAFVVVGTTVTYAPAANGFYILKAGDRITFVYLFGSTSAASLSGLADVAIVSPAAGQVLAYNTSTSAWNNVPGSTSFGLVANGTSNVTVANNGPVTVGVAGTANVATFTSTGVTITGNLLVSGANVSLGPVGNVKITGGISGQALQSVGSGNLQFVNPTRLVTSVFATGSYTFPAGFVPVNVIYNNMLYDPQSLYNATTGRFQPKVEGWYEIAASADVFGGVSNEASVTIQHSVVGSIARLNMFGFICGSAIGVAYFNGTTDYAFVVGVSSPVATRGQDRARPGFIAKYLGL